MMRGLLAATLLAIRIATTEGALPLCLRVCSSKSTTPCTSDSFPALIDCLNEYCPSNVTLASYAVTLSPKIEYSCQQSYVPGDDTPTALLQMTGQGRCLTSPYDFQSFITSAGNNPWAAGVCRISVYPKEQCLGQSKSVALSLHGESCTFVGGRSARLDCGQSSDLSVARHYVQAMCQNTSLGTDRPESAAANAPASVASAHSVHHSSSLPGSSKVPSSDLASSGSSATIASTSMFKSTTTSSRPTVTLDTSLQTLPNPVWSNPISQSFNSSNTHSSEPTSSNKPAWSQVSSNITSWNSTSASNTTTTSNSTSPVGCATPFHGGAEKESKDASIAVLFALIAAFVLL